MNAQARTDFSVLSPAAWAEKHFVANHEFMVERLRANLEGMCRASNRCHASGKKAEALDWDNRAQNVRRVLVDMGALPKESL